MRNKFYITTPIYYINASPHIGHSYTNIAADTLARYMRLALGDDKVWFLTGTDEHGQKIQRAALAQNLSPIEFTDKMVKQFEDLWAGLGMSHNDFIRTTQKRHIQFVQRALDILYRKGDIYKDKYEGLYCTPCETFWLKQQVTGNLCPDCQRPLEEISEENYFFNLEKYQSWLMQYIDEHADFVKPDSRRNEVLSFLRLNKLAPLCISRPKERLSWGIPLPFSPEHVTYVWFDALTNYTSAVGEFDAQDKYQSKWWPADLQLIGKDILRHHVVYWPIMLKALNIEMPKTVFAHGWWMVGDTKMSKSRGNVVDPIEMVNKYGVDIYRYFLLRDTPFGLDGTFSEESLIKRFNSDLANDLGNLVYRTLTMAEKYFSGNIPQVEFAHVSIEAEAINKKMQEVNEASHSSFDTGSEYNFSAYLDNIWALINMANKYVETVKPWNLAKENKTDELKSFIRLLVEVIRQAAVCIEPFMPKTAQSIKEQVGVNVIKKGEPLFPRIEIK